MFDTFAFAFWLFKQVAGKLPENKIMLEEECDYVVKRLVCASNDAKYLIKTSIFHCKR